MKICKLAFAMGLCLAAASLRAVPAPAQTAPVPAGQWIAAWYTPPFPPTAVLGTNDVRVFAHQTVRQIARLQVAGQRIRVRLTNELGLVPVSVGAVHIAISSANAVTEPDTDHVLTFNGHREAVIPVGQALVSDAVDMTVGAFADVAISVYYPGRIAPSGHLTQLFLSGKGDHAEEAVWPNRTASRGPGLVSGIEVTSTRPHPVVVAFGDSITEGAGATPGTNNDWPEQLARRLDETARAKGWVVINSGISGNRLLHEGAGPKALDRFDRDALDIPGVSAIIVTEGINDIGWAFDPEGDSGPLTSADVIGAYQQLIARSHARGIRIYAGTLNPFEGAGYFYPEGESLRLAVNEWIRTSGAFDGVFDFDKATRDPRHPARYLGADQCGDNLHPNDVGYRAMASVVSLN